MTKYYAPKETIPKDETPSQTMKRFLRHYYDRYTDGYIKDNETNVRMLLYFERDGEVAGKQIEITNEDSVIRCIHNESPVWDSFRGKMKCKRCGCELPIYTTDLKLVEPIYCPICGFDSREDYVGYVIRNERLHAFKEIDLIAEKERVIPAKKAFSIRNIFHTDFSNFYIESAISGIQHGGFVYFICDGEKIKIGKTKNPEQRLSGIQTGNPNKCYFYDVFYTNISCSANDLERTLHEQFKNCRISGEWFDAKTVIDWLEKNYKEKSVILHNWLSDIELVMQGDTQ